MAQARKLLPLPVGPRIEPAAGHVGDRGGGHRDTGANSFQRQIVDRAVLSLKDAGVPSFLIE
jgi:hypothetical protein